MSRKDDLIESIVEIENQIDHVFDEKTPVHERVKDIDLMSIPGLEKRLKERSNYFNDKLE